MNNTLLRPCCLFCRIRLRRSGVVFSDSYSNRNDRCANTLARRLLPKKSAAVATEKMSLSKRQHRGNNSALEFRRAPSPAPFEFVSVRPPPLRQFDLGQVFLDLALDALQRVVDRLDVPVEVARHLLIALSLEIREEH